MRAIHQFLPTYEPSAVGNHASEVQRTLRGAGYESEVFAQFIRGRFEGHAHRHDDYGTKIKANDDDLLLYHMAIGSDVAEWLRQRPQALMLDHHNITPVDYYEPWDPTSTYGMAWGRRQMRELTPRAVAAIADSEYNRRELEDLGYPNTSVVPILLDFAAFDHSVDEAALQRMQDDKSAGGSDWLFVGWIAPHKCQHDIIRAFALYKKLYDPDARLHLVGRSSAQSYFDACQKMIADLGLGNSAYLHGGVSDGELGAFYRIADVLVSMSEHEGVGIPLLESMHHDVPVVAFAAAAVPETVGNAGILLARKRPSTVAAAVNRVITDVELNAELRRRGAGRLDMFSLERNERRLLDAVAAVDHISERS